MLSYLNRTYRAKAAALIIKDFYVNIMSVHKEKSIQTFKGP